MDAEVRIRGAGPGDEPSIVVLLRELAGPGDVDMPLTEAYCRAYLAAPGCAVLLAEVEGRACGMLSYTVRPNLFHAGNAGLIEELVVHEPDRGRGIGHALVDSFMQAAVAQGCVEVSVATFLDNEGAIRFYRAHGFVDEALFLERHLV